MVAATPYLYLMSTATSISTERLSLEATELERREGGGERIRLLWIPEVNDLLVEILKIESGEISLRQVREGQAYKVFNHPYGHNEISPSYDYKVTAGEIAIQQISS